MYLANSRAQTRSSVTTEYNERFYRSWVRKSHFLSFKVALNESDLFIRCDRELKYLASQVLGQVRADIERYAQKHPLFLTSLIPIEIASEAPGIVRKMELAARTWNVGPMAAVAGAVAGVVGESLLKESQFVIVENGGDIFAKSDEPLTFLLYAGEDSPFTNKICFTCKAHLGVGVCTSSARVGPSLSLGKADAVVAVHRDPAIADAAATAIANRIQGPDDVEPVVEEERKKQKLLALIVAQGSKLGAFGDIVLSKSNLKRGLKK